MENKSEKCIISVDCMGGDFAPKAIIDGIALASEELPWLYFLLFGQSDLILPLIENHSILKDRFDLTNCADIITGDTSPTEALRPRMQNSSMRKCLEAVRDGHAGGAISAGNTGAYLTLARYLIKTIDGISRPAIISRIPTAKGQSVMLDLGANISCDADNLVEFAVMGAIFAKYVLNIDVPSVGLLNVGIESQKGHDTLLLAKQKLEDSAISGMNFLGFVEGDSIYAGDADVFVTDGFTGNISLKTAEGIVRTILDSMKKEFHKSFFVKIGAIFARSAFKNLKKSFDPRLYNGALWLGLKGVAVKSHGSTDPFGFACAIKTTASMIKNRVSEKIAEEIERAKED